MAEAVNDALKAIAAGLLMEEVLAPRFEFKPKNPTNRPSPSFDYVHPFREGNGRTQAFYLEQLAEQAGHTLDLRLLDPERWIAASRAAHHGDYTPLAEEIARAIPSRRRGRP